MSTLNPRELQVLRLTCDGLSVKQIARQLGIVERTVKAHKLNIADKIDARTCTQQMLWAIRNGIYCPWCNL